MPRHKNTFTASVLLYCLNCSAPLSKYVRQTGESCYCASCIKQFAEDEIQIELFKLLSGVKNEKA